MNTEFLEFENHRGLKRIPLLLGNKCRRTEVKGYNACNLFCDGLEKNIYVYTEKNTNVVMLQNGDLR